MNTWMARLAAWARGRLGQGTTARMPRPLGRRGGRPAVEGLERREVLSTTAVHPFMTIPAAIEASQSASVQFQLAPGDFTAGHGKTSILIGLDTRPAPGSTAATGVGWLDGPTGPIFPLRGSTRDPMLVSVPVPRTTPGVYTARVGNRGGLGGFGLDGFLAGDVNGDQKVDTSDLDAVLAAYGSHSGDARYDAAADINQDGRVGRLDYGYTRQNLGAQASYIQTLLPVAAVVAPIVTATQVVVPQTTVSVQPVAAVATAPPGYVLVPASSMPSAAWPSQTMSGYPTVQYGVAVPSAAVYASVPTVSTVAASSVPAQTATTYSYTPNGTTPVYLTPVR